MKISHLLILLLCALPVLSSGLSTLSRGSFLSVEKQTDVLVSLHRTFSCGFYKVGDNAYCFSIWFTNSADKTVVWTANRNTPVNGKNSRLTLLQNGNLILTDHDGSVVWSTNTFSRASVEARLLETGNLVINQKMTDTLIWESFRFPTDTILPSQPITKNTTLVSVRSKGTFFSGFYNFKFDDNNVLHLIYDGPMISSIFWPNTTSTVFVNGRTPYNSSRIAVFDDNGRFKSSDGLQFNALDYGFGPKRRLTLEYDGTLRLYSLVEPTGSWDVSWFGGADFCRVHGLCGAYGVCVYDTRPSCTCPYGFARADPSDWSKGCVPLFNLTCNIQEVEFMKLHNTDFYGYDIPTSYGLGVTYEQCRNACASDCACQGFGYAVDGLAQCYPKGKLLNGFHMPRSKSNMHIKVPRGFVRSNPEVALERTYNLSCSGEETVLSVARAQGYRSKEEYMKYMIGIVVSVAIFEVTCAALGWWFMFGKTARDELVNLGYMVIAMGFKRFTYKELKKATRNFKQEVGRGGFGTVYKGVLDNGTVVAVKRLEGLLQGEAQFWAEVTIIGKINHMNLVKLYGFCVENERKLLVYEYLENGSLDKILFSDSNQKVLTWDERYNVALGTAKGLSYLHEECLQWILHCDVKPENILMDDRFEPKVSDFGMSMLFKDSDDMGFSKVRGTRGYIAPEWMMSSKIDAKVDVYSYGMVLLELVSGKNANTFQTWDNNLVQWVRTKIGNKEVNEVVDPKLNGEYDEEKVERVVKVGMLCVGEDPVKRPSMSKVVELLSRYEDQNEGF